MTSPDGSRPEDDDLGTFTVEDDPGGTVDPADLAGTASSDDADVGYAPEASAEDDEGV